MTDSFNLQRFVDAQNRDGSYDAAAAELRRGRKSSHWMWWVFPQLRGLGRTHTSDTYGIASREEAIAYLDHEVLGPRLRRCAQLLLNLGGDSPELVLGTTDAMKLKSSMTLFAEVAEDPDVFKAVLRKYYRAGTDRRTLQMLRGS
jgi:uncharacterized protein (DUF1810 family)